MFLHDKINLNRQTYNHFTYYVCTILFLTDLSIDFHYYNSIMHELLSIKPIIIAKISTTFVHSDYKCH